MNTRKLNDFHGLTNHADPFFQALQSHDAVHVSVFLFLLKAANRSVVLTLPSSTKKTHLAILSATAGTSAHVRQGFGKA